MTYHLICLYLFAIELRHTCTYGIFYLTHICYISNGRGLAKSALRILLLSTYHAKYIAQSAFYESGDYRQDINLC